MTQTPPAIACEDSDSPADFCIHQSVPISFAHAPSSMPKIARCARMTSEIGRAAVSVHGWPQRPPPRALSLKPVPVGRCSALVRYLLWGVSKRARKKSTTRADARAARVRCLCRVPARRVCLLLCILHITDPEHRVCPFFCVLPAFISPELVSVEEIQGKY